MNALIFCTFWPNTDHFPTSYDTLIVPYDEDVLRQMRRLAHLHTEGLKKLDHPHLLGLEMHFSKEVYLVCAHEMMDEESRGSRVIYDVAVEDLIERRVMRTETFDRDKLVELCDADDLIATNASCFLVTRKWRPSSDYPTRIYFRGHTYKSGLSFNTAWITIEKLDELLEDSNGD